MQIRCLQHTTCGPCTSTTHSSCLSMPFGSSRQAAHQCRRLFVEHPTGRANVVFDAVGKLVVAAARVGDGRQPEQ